LIEEGGLKYRDSPMHPECFKCAYCKKVIAREQFASKDDKPFCVDCYGKLFAKQCKRCLQPITGRLYIVIKNL